MICRFFGHAKGETWAHQGINSACRRCKVLYKSGGFYKLRNFTNAYGTCKVSGYIYRLGKNSKKYAKNHDIPIKQRVPLFDRLSKDWVIND